MLALLFISTYETSFQKSNISKICHNYRKCLLFYVWQSQELADTCASRSDNKNQSSKGGGGGGNGDKVLIRSLDD